MASYLELDSEAAKSLPQLPMVSVFKTCFFSSRSLLFSPLSAVMAASKMPKLGRLVLNLHDHGTGDSSLGLRLRNGKRCQLPSLRTTARPHADKEQYIAELANNITQLPHSINTFTLTYRLEIPENQLSEIQNIAAEECADSLSQALFSYSLRPDMTHFYVEACVERAVFWPDQDPDDADLPCWPSMERFNIMISPCSPRGKWFTDIDPRISEVDGKERYYIAAAKCMRQMPCVTDFSVSGVRFRFWSEGRSLVSLFDAPTPRPGPQVIQEWKRTAEKKGVKFCMRLKGTEETRIE